MNVPKTLQDLEELIENGIEENINLEYKSAKALQNKNIVKREIAKDISSMSNSAGGIIIYGIKEFDNKDKRHLPEKITPINRTEFSKEKLEQIINGNISPKIDSLRINPISLNNINEVVYVVEIPQSNTAHQNTIDHKYYKRYNFESIPMLDYEIRDVMNRNKYPIVDLEFQIHLKLDIIVYEEPTLKELERVYCMIVIPKNKGFVYAKFINFEITIPRIILWGDDNDDESIYQIFKGDNYIRDFSINSDGTKNIDNSGFYPLLPGMKGKPLEIRLVDNIEQFKGEIEWKVQADNAVSNVGKLKIEDLVIMNLIPEEF